MDYLLYISTAKQLQTDADLLEILKVSRKNNEQNNITGLLLYNDGTFIQLLEGGAAELASTYSAIFKDIRHKNVMLLTEGESAGRLFPAWTMGFKTINADELKTIKGYFDPKSLAFNGESEHEGLMMIKVFSETN